MGVPPNPPADPYRDALKREFAFAEWPGRDVSGPVRKFLPDPAGFGGFTREERWAFPGTRGAFIDYFATDDGQRRITVRVMEYDSAADAHEGLVDVLQTTMAPRLPRCVERGFDVGDVCFCGYADPVDSVVFVRANVLIRVESIGEEPTSVVDAASELDRQIVARLA